MTEAAILQAIKGVDKRLDDLNSNVSAYRQEGQTANAAIWKDVNDGKKCMTEMKLKTKDLEGKIRGLGKDIQTDCSVNTVYLGKKYCFGNETAKTLFLKRPDDFLLQAHIYHSSKQEAGE